MSKDVIIAGAIAAGCVALVAVALLAPKSKPEGGEPAKTSEPAFTSMPPGLDASPAGGFSFGPATSAGAGFASTPGTGAFPELPPASTTALPPAGTGFGPQTSLNPAPALPGTGFTPAEPAPAAPAAATEHTVAAGELLGDISLKHYGSSKYWKRIVEANPGMDPHSLKVGQKLKIPPAPTAAAAAGAGAGAAVTAAPGERTYTIKASDSLYGIAQRELGKGSRWKEIQSLNPGLNSNDLKVGKVIKLPGAAAGAATTATATASAASGDAAASGGKTHTVAKGETLADISKKHFGTSKRWKDIVAANPGVSPEGLKIGQKLNIPGGSAEAAAPAAGVTGTGTGDYTVKAGDTIRSIAASQLGNGNEWKKIQEANPGLNPRALRPGQKIKIPGKASAPASVATPAPVPATAPIPAPTVGGAAPAPFSPAPFDAGPAVPDFANPYAPAPADAGGLAPLGTPAGPQR